MKRREALKRSVFLTGCGLSAGTIASIISSCKTESASDIANTFLGSSNVNLLGEIVETIIPTTDTPGAKAAEVHLYIDAAASQFKPDEQLKFKEALEMIAKGDGKSFMKMSTEEREAFLLSIDAQGGEMNPFKVLKGLTLRGYFTSEIGATQALDYDPIPGKWIPCMDMTPDTRLSAL